MQRIDLMQKQIMKLTAELTTTQKSNAMLMVKLNEQQDQLNKLHYVVEKLEKTADGSIVPAVVDSQIGHRQNAQAAGAPENHPETGPGDAKRRQPKPAEDENIGCCNVDH